MTRPNNIPLLGLCAIAALALALWLLLADGGGDVHAPEANTPATALDTQAALDVPLSAKAEGDTGTLPLPEKTANLDQTDKRGFEETTAETEEPALVPVYGALVRRGGAIARFELLDAHARQL